MWQKWVSAYSFLRLGDGSEQEPAGSSFQAGDTKWAEEQHALYGYPTAVSSPPE